jgi:predicted O-methyltransferase YrrM
MKITQSLPRKILYTNNIAKGIYGLVKNRSIGTYDNLNHLSLFEPQSLKGSLMRDEAIFLYSLVKMIRPKVIVEFGFSRGHSSLNFLYALDKTAHLYSFDISETAKDIAENVLNGFPNFHFRFKSQLDFVPQDIDNKKIDLVYFDAVYDRDKNMTTFERLGPSLNENAIIALHDTNTWRRQLMDRTHIEYANKKPQNWLNEDEFQSQKGQREFYNEFVKQYPDYSAITFHNSSTILAGISLLQKKSFLKTQ